MIIGVGIDLVLISSIAHWLEGDKKELFRFFSRAEAELILKSPSPKDSLAAHYAAKEAFGKALGTGLKGITLCDIEVLHDLNGRPTLHLAGTAKALASRLGQINSFVSLSHKGDYGVACLILESC